MSRQTRGGRALLLGAGGFGVGGALGGVLGVAADAGLLTYAILGLLGAGALTRADPGLPAGRMVAAGTVGALTGFTVGLFVALTLWEPPVGGGVALAGLVGGATTGWALGCAVRAPAALAGALAGAGGLGFLLGGLVWAALREGAAGWSPLVAGAVGGAVPGAVGGAVLGYAFGRLWPPSAYASR